MSKKVGTRSSRKTRRATRLGCHEVATDVPRLHGLKTLAQWLATMDAIPAKFPKRRKQLKQPQRNEIL